MGQQALPITRGDIGIPLIAVKEVLAVKRHVGQACPRQARPVSSNGVLNVGAMVVKDDGDEIAPLR